ncbi:MAG: GAF domain-containing protein [Cyanobacteria bacterium J06638_22]
MQAMEPMAAHRLGYSVETWVGKLGLALFHPDDRGQFLHILSGDVPQAAEGNIVRLMTRDRQVLPVRLRCHPMQGMAGNKLVMGIATPLSEAELSAATGKQPLPIDWKIYQAIVDRLPDSAVLLFDTSLRYVLVGGNAIAETGFRAADLQDKTIWQVFPDATCEQLEPFYRAVLAGHEDGLEVTYGDRHYRLRGLPIRDDQGQVVAGMITSQDITSLRRIEQILQYQAETERRHRLVAQTSAEFSRHIRHSLDLEDILETAVTQIQQMLEADRVLIYRLDEHDAGQVITESVCDPSFHVSHQIGNAGIFPDACRQIYQQGGTKAINDTHEDATDVCSNCVLNFGARAKLVVPILCQEKLWGLLIAHQCTYPRIWQSWEVDLMSQLAGQLEIAVHQSSLYQQVQRLNTDLEQKIQLRTQQLQQANDFEATLKRITDKVRDSLDEDQILQAAVQEVAIILRVMGCNAAIYDTEAGTSSVRYEYTKSALPYQGRVVRLNAFSEAYDQLLMGRTIQFCSLIPNPIRGLVATLAVPILDEKGVLGDLWLVNHKDYAFTEQDIRLVEQVANQCAIAIRQARLYAASMSQVRELEKVNQLKDDFLSTVSHELRTPMSNVKMAIQMLEIALKNSNSVDSHSGRLERYIKILNEESQREINLINDLLDLSRLDSGAETLTLASFQFNEWLPDRIHAFEEQAATHNQLLQIDCPSDLPPINTDRAKLDRILTELLTNAFKYTPPQERIRITARALPNSQAASSLQICITNTGVEISPEEQAKVFEKFYRIPNNDPWKHGGTGLGLALAKELAQHLGGSLVLTSRDQKTCFTVELPLQPWDIDSDGRNANSPLRFEAAVESPSALPDS